MVYKHFRTVCTLRVVVLALTVSIALFLCLRGGLGVWGLLPALLAVYQVYALVHFVEKTNRDLTRFLESIKYGDFAQSFKDEGQGQSFSDLRSAFNSIMEGIRRLRAEKEEHYHYLQTIVHHVGIGLLVFQSDGEVELINPAAKRLLKVPVLKNIATLTARNPDLVEMLVNLPPREKGFIRIEEENLYLVLYATEFRMRGQHFKLVSLQNIQRELEEKEMEAWQKLIRIITHEIMNSVTPISSLASTVNGLIKDNYTGPGATAEDVGIAEDVQQALQTIVKRSQGLLHFVDAFRNLTLLPKPKFQIVTVQTLFGRIARLMEPTITEKGISFTASVDPQSLELSADPELIEQVLINLLLNALQAVEGRAGAAIKLCASLGELDQVLIQVSDNGPGIPVENLEKIFIPFFSTKEGGSGIGLSLSRQIMGLHHGSIRAHSEPDVQTTFTLAF